jgi:hypothetical protein
MEVIEILKDLQRLGTKAFYVEVEVHLISIVPQHRQQRQRRFSLIGESLDLRGVSIMCCDETR